MTKLRGERAGRPGDERGFVALSNLREGAFGRAAAAAAPLVLMLVGSRLLWRHVPLGVLLTGAELGLLSALIAVGLALTYRANRIINFAQADLGIVPSLLAVLLILAKGWSYWFALPIGLVAAGVLGALVRVDAMLKATSHPADEIVGHLQPVEFRAAWEYTVEQVAVNAVMAGARPEYFPVILALAASELSARSSSSSSCGASSRRHDSSSRLRRSASRRSSWP